MKAPSIAVLAVVACLGGATVGRADWAETTMPDEHFSAMFPGAPERTTPNADDPDLHVYLGVGPGVSCAIATTRVGTAIGLELQAKYDIEDPDDVAAGYKNPRVSYRKLPVGDDKVEAIVVDKASDTAVTRALYAYNDNWFYAVVARVRPAEGGELAGLDRCIDGFKILP
jgi:hypothetical protein